MTERQGAHRPALDEDLERLEQVLHAASQGESPPPHVDERVMSEIRAGRPVRSTRRRRSAALRTGRRTRRASGSYAAIAATVFLAVGLVALLATRKGKTPPHRARGEQPRKTTVAERPRIVRPREAPTRQQQPALPVEQPRSAAAVPTEQAPPSPAPVSEQPTPAPKVVERPLVPALAPKQALTATHLARLARVDGRARYSRDGGRWSDAAAGVKLLAGDRLETFSGTVCLELAGGSVVYVNRMSALRLFEVRTDGRAAAVVNMAKGEVFVDDVGRNVHVETLDGLFSPVGTSFNVKRSMSTSVVVVEQGVVRARSKARVHKAEDRADAKAADLSDRVWSGKAVRVGAGQQSRVRRGAPAGRPTKANIRRGIAWMERSFWVTRSLCDFEKLSDIDLFRDPKARFQDVALTRSNATRGAACLRLQFKPGSNTCLKGATDQGFPGDWSGYTHFRVDIFNATGRAIGLNFEFRDKIGQAVYDRRVDVRRTLAPGANVVRIAIAGRKTNDKSRELKLSAIESSLMCFQKPPAGAVYVDNMRLERVR